MLHAVLLRNLGGRVVCVCVYVCVGVCVCGWECVFCAWTIVQGLCLFCHVFARLWGCVLYGQLMCWGCSELCLRFWGSYFFSYMRVLLLFCALVALLVA